MIELVLGGARSGKSRFAEQLALNSGKKKIYIATAQALDEEMSTRVKIHQQRRNKDWRTIEEPLLLAQALEQNTNNGSCILVDCLTLWLSNLLQESEQMYSQEKDKLLALLATLAGHIIFVSNEVGSGIVPMGEMSRKFVDEIGWLHQDIAKISNKVTLITAGLPQVLKNDFH